MEHFTGAPSVVSTKNHIVYVNEEARHGVLGHLMLLNLKQLVHPMSWGGPIELLPRQAVAIENLKGIPASGNVGIGANQTEHPNI